MDQSLQLRILEKLRQYGDDVLGDQSTSKENTKGKKKMVHHHDNTIDDGLPRKKKKKKKGKRTNCISPNASNGGCNKRKHSSLREFEEELKSFRQSREEENAEKEGATVLDRRKDEQMRKKRKAPEVIVFEDPTMRKRKQPETKSNSRPRPSGVELSERELELDQARHEVWKLGISGLSYDDKEKQEAAKAVQLGAKPAKRTCVNYKEFMETKKQKKIEEQEQREIDRQMGLKVPKKKEGKITLQNKGFWTDKTQRKGVYVDGQLGKYKRGVQVFSKMDIARIKKTIGKGRGKR